MKYIQEENYPEDIKALKTNKSISKDSKIFKLSPFLSENGRLQNANLSVTHKHPIVLPSNHRLVKMIIYDAHEKVFHSGVSATLTQIREKYWIIKGRQSIKSTLSRCIICKRFNVLPGK
ncbi:integrase catalytic domain-containing protein [Nephila pilipes]|uniref:Integrase catalytic domain-containing protein n=1 Tax=Nephila pilipes TaxID=299642 RepID=A0A8X6TM76_NEPPI|nr:integrase catalytic domain-containing protein [Nephila pilipes]